MFRFSQSHLNKLPTICMPHLQRQQFYLFFIAFFLVQSLSYFVSPDIRDNKIIAQNTFAPETKLTNFPSECNFCLFLCFNSLLINRSLQNFAHGTAVMLSRYVQDLLQSDDQEMNDKKMIFSILEMRIEIFCEIVRRSLKGRKIRAKMPSMDRQRHISPLIMHIPTVNYVDMYD